ncbi:MAG: amidohydrolase [Desulfobacteraceae bacterium]|nr:amidohydrolase [Desulfobacteraceae bacterium]
MKLALFSATIYTGSQHSLWAEALLIEDNRIAAVGNTADIEQLMDSRTRFLSLPGRLITPGLVDGHCHFVNQGVLLQRVDLRGTVSLGSCQEKISQTVKATAPGDWIVGRGWDQHRWPEGREPTAKDLDALTPDHPIMMTRVCGHSIWVNSLALSIAGITADTPDPPGGYIEKDPATNEPTGIIRESFEMITSCLPCMKPENMRKAALAAQKEALSLGITAVHTCEGLPEWQVLSQMETDGHLKIRVYHLLHPEDVEAADAGDIHPDFPRDHLWFNHVKLYADGSLGSGTAYLHAPYEGEPDNCGIPFLSLSQLQEKIEYAYGRNCNVAIHAIGDRAVTNCLQAIGNARSKYPGPHRDRIEHVQLFRPDDLELFRKLEITASVQPVFLLSDKEVATLKWGRQRCRYAYAWKTLLDDGIRIQFGSDAPVEPINPLLGIQAELQRSAVSSRKSDDWVTHGSLTLPECISACTLQPAWTSNRENDLGTIEPGKLADLTVFHQNLFQVPAAGWHDIEVDLTIVNGEIVFQKAPYPALRKITI